MSHGIPRGGGAIDGAASATTNSSVHGCAVSERKSPMIEGSVKPDRGAFDPSCPHCQSYHDGMACAFHSARAEHERGECAGTQGNPSGCFFCPEPGLHRPWMSEPATPTPPCRVDGDHVVPD